MAEKRLKSFVVIGDDDAKTTRIFFYIGSGENRSATAMRENALGYYEEKFPETWLPEIKDEKNYPKDGHEFNKIVQAAVAENRVEYTRIPNFGDRWVVTSKEEATGENNGGAGAVREEHEQGEAFMEENYGADSREPVSAAEERRRQTLTERPGISVAVVGTKKLLSSESIVLPEHRVTEDDYEPTEEELDKHYALMDSGYSDPGDENDYVEEEITDEEDTAELPALDSITSEATIEAIGGYNVDEVPSTAPTNPQTPARKPQVPFNEHPTQKEMDEELEHLRENPGTQERGNTGDLNRADSRTNVLPFTRKSGYQEL